MIDISAIPTATVLIMLISATISFINMGLNRLLISHMIGWQEYKGMRKETSEYNSRRMAALRANDTKTLEKLKKKEKQIMNMQTKMMKPQMLLLLFTVVYFIIWPILVFISWIVITIRIYSLLEMVFCPRKICIAFYP